MVSAWKVASGNGRRYNGWMTELVLMLLRECIFLASLLNDANCGELRAIRQQFSCLNDTMAESRPYFIKCNGNLTINSKARSYSVIVWDGQCAQLLDRYLLGSNISNPDFSASFLLTKQIFLDTRLQSLRQCTIKGIFIDVSSCHLFWNISCTHKEATGALTTNNFIVPWLLYVCFGVLVLLTIAVMIVIVVMYLNQRHINKNMEDMRKTFEEHIYDCTNAKNARIAQGSFRPQLIERKIPSRALTTMSSDSKSCRSPENIPMISESMKGGDMSALLEQNSVSPQARERDRSLSSYSQSKANTYFKEYN
ncbi:hypothetical protein Tcan_05884 [Toxocara canis]|uniref:Uncharacterized protein n=1 Tax=Toxocara canis TaxID=6265 RepID=A0A0B2V591_TOXCA|nr:hypothetical protein Tcan_05884 [Toxocara canis]